MMLRSCLVLLVAAVSSARSQNVLTYDPSTYTPGAPDYNCDRSIGGPSLIIPNNVNQVRPGDIRVVGALGDSLSCANGALGTNLAEVLNEYEGVSFAVGGDQDLSYTVAMGNVFKYYNPHVYGYSKNFEVFLEQRDPKVEQFNAAYPGATVWDMPGQAQDLIWRMKNSSVIDYENDWKYVDIFYGGNDQCAYCREPDRYSPANMTIKLNETLQILSQMPRTFVQLLGMFDLNVLRSVGKGVAKCQVMHITECGCSNNPNFTSNDFLNITLAYQQNQMMIQNAMTYERDDWTFVVQTPFQDVRVAPMWPNGTVDLTWFAPDCFHFSIKGHNTVTRWLWQSMMQPVGGKVTNANLSDNAYPLVCPDPSCPYLRTIKNSQQCWLTPQATLNGPSSITYPQFPYEIDGVVGGEHRSGPY